MDPKHLLEEALLLPSEARRRIYQAAGRDPNA